MFVIRGEMGLLFIMSLTKAIMKHDLLKDVVGCVQGY